MVRMISGILHPADLFRLWGTLLRMSVWSRSELIKKMLILPMSTYDDDGEQVFFNHQAFTFRSLGLSHFNTAKRPAGKEKLSLFPSARLHT